MAVPELHFFAANDVNGATILEVPVTEDYVERIFVRPALRELGYMAFRFSRQVGFAIFDSGAFQPETCVRLLLPDVSTTRYVWGCFLNDRVQQLVARIKAGENFDFGGPGPKHYLSRAILWDEKYSSAGYTIDKANGVARWAEQATPGRVLDHLRDEDAANTQAQFLPGLTLGFTQTNDSASVAWANPIAEEGQFELRLGDNYLTDLFKMEDSGDFETTMYLGTVATPVLRLDAWQSYGRDLSGAIGASAVHFKEAVNILGDLSVAGDSSRKASHALVEGLEDAYGHAVRSSYDPGEYAKAVGISHDTTSNENVLDRYGLAWLRRQANGENEIMVPHYPGFSQAAGLYLPGPGAEAPGGSATNGHYWIGDTVSLTTGGDSGGTWTPLDYRSEDQRVMAITMEMRSVVKDGTPTESALSWNVIAELNVERGSDTLPEAAAGEKTMGCKCKTQPQPAPDTIPQPEDTITELVRWSFTTNGNDDTNTYGSGVNRSPAGFEMDGVTLDGPFGVPYNGGGHTGYVPVGAGDMLTAAMDVAWKYSPSIRDFKIRFYDGLEGVGSLVEEWDWVTGAGHAVKTEYHIDDSHPVPVGATHVSILWPNFAGTQVDNVVLGTISTAEEVEQPTGAVDYGGACPHDSLFYLPADYLMCRLADLEDRPAAQVPYDNTDSGIDADNVQTAIDALDSSIEEVADRVTILEGNTIGDVTEYTEVVGDGAATSFNVTHGFGTGNLVVQAWDLSGSLAELVSVGVSILDDDTITVDTAPTVIGTTSLRVVVHAAPNSVTSGGGGGGGFAPSDISGLGLWLDADDDATISFGSGAAVATWADKSGAGRNMTQATGANQPTRVDAEVNGRSVIRFDGTNDRLELASGNLDLLRNLSGATLFVVNRVDDTTDVKTLLWASIGGSNNSRARLQKGAAAAYEIGGRRLDADALDDMATPPTYSSGVVVIDTVNYDWADSAIYHYVDGTLSDSDTGWLTNGSTSDTNSQFISVGRGSVGGSPDEFMDGDICEVLVWQRVLTSTERDDVVTYLSDKWLGGNDINVEWAWVGAVRE